MDQEPNREVIDNFLKGEVIKTVTESCPHCGALLNAATCITERDTNPEEGDYTICIVCGHLLVFAADLSLRLPTEIEQARFHEQEDQDGLASAIGLIIALQYESEEDLGK